MRGRLVREDQSISDPTFFQPKRRATLLDVAYRGSDIDSDKEESKILLSESKKVYGSRPEQVRTMPFESSEKSLYESLEFIDSFTKNQIYRGSMKQGLRDTDKSTHEWIPCQLMADCLTRDTLIGLKGGWLLLQKQLRTATAGLVFLPKIVTCRMKANDRNSSKHNLRKPKEFSLQKVERYYGSWRVSDLKAGESVYLLQGHEGCMKPQMDLERYQGDQYDKEGWLSFGSSEFHNNLLYIFDKYEDLSLMPKDLGARKKWLCQQQIAFLTDLKNLASYWLWKPTHPFSYFYPFAIPFMGYIGKGKDRKGFVVDDKTLGAWLDWVEDTREETLGQFDTAIKTLPLIYG